MLAPGMAAEAAASSGQLVATKLHAPPPREAIERGRLERALSTAPHRVKLVRAPAGWGKSTAVMSWACSPVEHREFAWFAIDPADDEPTRFWMYAIEALRTLDPSVGTGSLPLLLAPGTSFSRHVLPALVNELAALSRPGVLVLEDYHAIRSSEIHEQLAKLVEYLPEPLQIVIVSRSEPLLPLARWRAQGDLFELDANALRFDEGEAEGLLNGSLGLDLDAEQVARLHDRTEGWAAGLYLAALSLRNAQHPASFVEDFAGDDRNIIDFLGAEVLASQTPEVRRMLLRSSIVERFTPSLVEAVADIEGAAELLREVEGGNLFLVPLDSKREWYRYHHLFRQLLQLELTLAEPGIEPELHRRAARWHLDAGHTSEGIRHTIAAGDHDAAGELIAANWAVALLGAAGDRTLAEWLAGMGEDAVRSDLRLCIARCYVGLSFGRMDDVATWLEIARAAPLPTPFLDGHTSAEGALACVRAAWLWQSGNVGASLEAAHEAARAEGLESPWHSIGVAVMGLANGALGDWEEGRKWMQEYARIGHEFGQHLNEVSGSGSAAAFDAERGEWRSAEQLAAHSLELSARHGIDEHWSSAGAHLARGLVGEQRGDLENARTEIERAVELSQRGAGPVTTATAQLHLARVLDSQGNRAIARVTLQGALEALESAPDPGSLPQRLNALESRLSSAGRSPAPGEELSPRELEVLRLLDTRMSQREIGDRLYVSLNTVKTHTKSIFRKLDASGRAEAVSRAHELGLL